MASNYKDSTNKDIFGKIITSSLIGHTTLSLPWLKTTNKANVVAPAWNPYNLFEEPYYLGSDGGYYGPGNENIAVIKQNTTLTLSNTNTDKFLGGKSTHYIIYRDNAYKIYNTMLVSGDGTAIPSNENKRLKFTENRVIVALQAGGGGGGAPYQVSLFEGHDGAGGGGGGCVMVVLNLAYLKHNLNSWYRLEIGAGGARSEPGFDSPGGKGGRTRLYFEHGSPGGGIDSWLIAHAEGGTGGKRGTGGTGGYTEINGYYFLAPKGTGWVDTMMYPVPGITYTEVSDVPGDWRFSCDYSCKGGNGRTQGNDGSSIPHITRIYKTNGMGGLPAGSSLIFYGYGGNSANGNSGGGGGGSVLGIGGNGGSATAEPGKSGTIGGGGGGARYTWGGKEGGAGGSGRVTFFNNI